MSETNPSDTIADDMLQGVRAIARFTGNPERRTHYLLERGLLPAGQVGRLWIASKRTLRQYHERITSGGAAK